MSETEPGEGDYLLSTPWLVALDAFLDLHLRAAQRRMPGDLLTRSRAFLGNPLKLLPLITWLLRNAPAEVPNRPGKEIAVARGAAGGRGDGEGDAGRRELKSRLERKLDALRAYDLDPAAGLARRITRLASSRRNLLLLPWTALGAACGRPDGGKLIAWRPDAEPAAVNVHLRTRCFLRRPMGDVGVVGPDWFRNMLAPEGLRAVQDLSGKPRAVIAGLGGGGDGGVEQIDALPGETRLLYWHCGDVLTDSQLRRMREGDRVFAADPGVARALREKHGLKARHLPPAVQPRLHHPVGVSRGGPDPASGAAALEEMPAPWRVLARAAMGEPPHRDTPAPGERAWMDDETRAAVRQYAALRDSIGANSVTHRLREMAGAAGLDLGGASDPVFSALVATKRPANLNHVLETIAAQRYRRRELVLVLHGDGFDENRLARRFDELGLSGRWLRVPRSRVLGECLQIGAEHCEGEIIGKMDDDNLYGADYIAETVMMLGCSDACVAGKRGVYRWFPQRGLLGRTSSGMRIAYTSGLVSGATLSFKREVLAEVPWRPLSRDEDAAFCADCFDSAIPLLATSPFNFVSVRHENGDHTWRVPRGYFDSRLSYCPPGAAPQDVLL